MCRSQPLLLALGTSFVGLASAGCRDTAAITGEQMMAVVPTPTITRVGVGQTAVVKLVVAGAPPGATDGRVTWRSTSPAIARGDTSVGLNQPILVHGVAVGETTLTYDLSVGGQRVTGSYPVSVVAP